jgi:hypothetical protein
VARCRVKSYSEKFTLSYCNVVGQVTALTIQSGEVVIDHGAIKDFTDAMTMGYTSVRRLCLRDFPWRPHGIYPRYKQQVITKIEKR